MSEERANSLMPVLEKVTAAVKELIEAITNALAPTVKEVVRVVSELYDAMLTEVARTINTKWLHYWKHGKKRRTREKYRKRIERELFKIIQRAAKEVLAN